MSPPSSLRRLPVFLLSSPPQNTIYTLYPLVLSKSQQCDSLSKLWTLSPPSLLPPSSSHAFSSQFHDCFAEAGSLIVSGPIAKGVSSSKLPLKLPEWLAEQDGCFASAQKGKEKGADGHSERILIPDLLYPPDFRLDRHPPKEKAGDQDIHIECNFIHLHQPRPIHNFSAAVNKLPSDFTTLLDDFNHSSQLLLPPLLPPSAAPAPPSAPITPLSALTPEVQDSIPNSSHWWQPHLPHLFPHVLTAPSRYPQSLNVHK
ncbi:hypothetical protein EV368DRAFT_90214 [Lentinula lateritia]|nr:hypothetical protein EV368DRAFT_90214 [Lentinula lateritia]